MTCKPNCSCRGQAQTLADVAEAEATEVKERQPRKHCALCNKMTRIEDMVDVVENETGDQLLICYKCFKEE